jgi:hypothetical protein
MFEKELVFHYQMLNDIFEWNDVDTDITVK